MLSAELVHQWGYFVCLPVIPNARSELVDVLLLADLLHKVFDREIERFESQWFMVGVIGQLSAI